MFEVIALLALLCAVILLYVLAVIDLKQGLLPNEYVMGLAMAGGVFHLCLGFYYLTIEDMALGALVGGGLLYIVRTGANYYYKRDALGLGDVKLLAAGGIWLGPYYVLLAITAGAAAGLVHGIGLALHEKRKSGAMPSFNQLSLPAGPGFIVGLVAAAIMQLHNLPQVLWP